MKQFLQLIFLIPFFSISQTIIGSDINGEAAFNKSGSSVSLSSDGSIVAIGAPFNVGTGGITGNVRVYENISGAWTPLGKSISGEVAGEEFGSSISLSSNGDILAIGAPKNDNSNGNGSGRVQVYKKNTSDEWEQIGSDIKGKAAGDNSGFSVSLSPNGSVVAIGAPYNSDNGGFSGHVRVYENISGTWTKVGGDINGEAATDESGYSVSLSSDGSRVAIGAPINAGNGAASGHVRVYENTSGTWTKIGEDIDGETARDASGWSVSLASDGSTVAIGAPYNDENGDTSGHVRVYENTSGTWTKIGEDIDGEDVGDQSGFSVSLTSDGSMVAIGAHYNSDMGNNGGLGHVRTYKNMSGTWTKIGSDIDGEAPDDESGFSVSLASNASIVAIGAPANNGNGDNSGHVRVYDLSAVLSSDTFVLSQFGILPNPAKNQTTIKLNKGLTLKKVAIYNSLGQFIESTTKEIINTSHLSTGLYHVQITTNKGKATKKLVIK